MQIHELNGYSGALDDAYMAVDNGSDTGKEKIKSITDPLNARIDNIIAGGTAPSAAEVTDARLGDNGYVYASLGDAIRAQTGEIKSVINISNIDLLNDISWEVGKINSSGDTPDNRRIRTIGYINVIDSISLNISIDNNYRVGVHTYDSSHNYIADSGWITNNISIARASNVCYIRLVVSDVNDQNADVSYAAHVGIKATYNLNNTINALADIQDQLANNQIIITPFVFENGNISSGADSSNGSTTRVRLKGYISTKDVTTILVDRTIKDYVTYIVYYDSAYNYISATAAIIDSKIPIDTTKAYFRIVVADYTGALWTNYINASTTEKDYIFYRDSDIATIQNIAQTVNNHLNADLFKIGSLSGGVYKDSSVYPYRIATPDVMSFPFDIYLGVKTGYRYAFHSFANGSFVSDSGWKTTLSKIPANTEFKITISELPEASTTPVIATYCNAVYCSYYTEDVMPHSFSGDHIPFKKQKYIFEDTGIKATLPSAITILPVTNMQGFGYYGGVIFQCYSDDVIELIDYATGNVIIDLNVSIGHGNAISFTDDYYDPTDEFPLAIISDTQSEPIIAKVVRITRASATVINTLSFPRAQAGYFANALYDSLNRVIYTVGYYGNSYVQPEYNKMVFAKWDYDSMVTNPDSTLTPAFIESFNTPFMLTMQASFVFNNKMLVVSSHWQDTDTKIYIVDLFKHIIDAIIDDFPASIKTHELEGIYIMENPNDANEYVGLLKTNDGYDSYKFLKSDI